MDLLALAVPFFLLAILIELGIDRLRKSELYRANDAFNSLSVGILNVTFGYFTKIVSLLIWGLVLRNFAVIDMPLAWFDLSLAGIGMWILAAVAWDFCYYWFHRFSHEISVLWAAHAVHHQSEEYNLTTALRQTSSGFLFGWIFYVPLFVIGFPLEILLTVNAINLIYQFWVHTQVVHRMGVLDYILVTPSNHRVHHAQNERYIDKNYGGMLILWDRIFGTFEDERDDEPVVFGVRKPLASWNPFWANWQVYDYLLYDAIRTRRWRDKLGIWFRRTGWRPDDVAGRFPKTSTDIREFTKFDPPNERGMALYLLVQFGATIVAVLAIAVMFAEYGAERVLVPCVLVWVTLFALGLFNEGRRSAVGIELLRLIVVVPVAVAMMERAFGGAQAPLPGAWGVAGGYILLSLFGLYMASKTTFKTITNKG